MTNRLYFFRDSNSYDTDEMLARIKVGGIRDPTNEPVEHILSETTVTGQDLRLREDRLHQTLRNKLGTAGYRNFIKDVFRHCGEKGDKFNLQLYFGAELEYDELLENAEEHERDKEPDELLEEPLSESLVRYEERGSGVIDLRFVLAETTRFDLSSIDDQDEDIVVDLSSSFVEVRVYTEEEIVAISNRLLDDEEKSSVRTVVESWSGGSINPEMNLMENELLALQNSLDGDNCGIDYGDFREDNITTAKYRGERNL